MKCNSLILGNGEIGSSLKKALGKVDKSKKIKVLDNKDKNYTDLVNSLTCDVLHICYPYSDDFIDISYDYIVSFNPKLVIIHSTVKVGTTEKIDKLVNENEKRFYVVHSPVRGQHPNLTESILYFVKYIGTEEEAAYKLAKKELTGIKTKWVNNSKATELGKMLSTSYYGVCISWHREMKRLCDSFGVDFDDAVTDFNETYNVGYKKFRPNVIRPVLIPPEGDILGHCVKQNSDLLQQQKKSKFLSLIK